METLKRARRRSFRLFTTWRFSLSECDSSICMCKVKTPIAGVVMRLLGDGLRHLGGDALQRERLDHIAYLHPVEIGQGNSAFETVLDLAGVILEALESFDFTGMDDLIPAFDTHLAIAADQAVSYIATGHRPHLADPEGLAYFGVALNGFFIDRLQQSGHGLRDLVNQLVDDA